ncbi:acyl-CoA dehydrogenase family protein [candidate division KSB1 bacterium]
MSGIQKDNEEVKTFVRRFAREKIEPHVYDTDRAGTPSAELIDLFRTSGLFGLIVPRKYGGAEAPFADLLTALEEIAAVCSGSASVLSVHTAALLSLIDFSGTSEKKIPDSNFLTGEKLLGYSFSGADSVTDDPSDRLSYTASGETYTLSGTVPRVLNGSICDAAVVAAYKEPEALDSPGNVFIIEKGTPRMTFGADEETLGLRALSIAPAFFDDCTVPGSAVVGSEGQASGIISRAESYARLMAAVLSVGVMRCAFDNAYTYGMQREQFGKKIGTFQALENMMVDMQVALNAGKGMIDRALSSFENKPEDLKKLAAQAKLFCADAAMKTATDAVQIHGGYGYMRDFPVEKLMRDAKMLQLLFGAPHHLKTLLAALL